MPLDLDKIENDIEYVQSLCMPCCGTALDEAILRICNAARLGAEVQSSIEGVLPHWDKASCDKLEAQILELCKLGAAVEEMPVDRELISRCDLNGNRFWVVFDRSKRRLILCGKAPTPLAALQAAKEGK